MGGELRLGKGKRHLGWGGGRGGGGSQCPPHTHTHLCIKHSLVWIFLDGNKLAKGMCLARKTRDKEVFI